METNDFVKSLNEAQDLMREEKYQDALIILDKLKEVDKAGNFKYNLTHKLYQLISNSQSLYNQQRVLSVIKQISKKQKSISILELMRILIDQEKAELDEQLLRREIELLILRSLLNGRIEGDKIIFQSP